MHRKLTDKLNHALARALPERRLFVRSEDGTRFFRLSPLGQAIGWGGLIVFVSWAIIATAILLMDNVGSGNVRQRAAREQTLYEQRLQTIAAERDARALEARAAQERFNLALQQVSEMQEALLASEDRRRELETGIGVIQATLRRTIQERDQARGSLEEMLAEARTSRQGPGVIALEKQETAETLNFLTAALDSTATERDLLATSAEEAKAFARNMVLEQQLRTERNDQIFRQLEDAVTVSLEPLDQMFRASGVSVEKILEEVRRGYSGQGGPLTPLVVSSMNGQPDPDALRANAILREIDRVNLYRIAVEKLPFSNPLHDSYRLTSPFGPRWGRFHAGNDMAAPTGTPVYAPADGIVIKAGWAGAYGRLIKIQHEFGYETRYGHLSAIYVKEGQRVSRGDKIGAIGSTGRSTGPHLHYEIRANGNAVNPFKYIKAGRNVF